MLNYIIIRFGMTRKLGHSKYILQYAVNHVVLMHVYVDFRY